MNRFFLASLFFFAPGLSFAAGEVYGGVGAGYSFLETEGEPFLIEDVAYISQDVSGTDVSVRAYIGVRYGRFIGLEIGYTDFGTINDDVLFYEPSPPFPPPPPYFVGGRTNVSIDTKAVDVFLVGYYPLNQDLNLFAKVGVARWDMDYDVESSFFQSSDDGTDLSYGLGAEYRATPRVKLRLDLQYYDLDFTDDLWALTASLKYGIPFGR